MFPCLLLLLLLCGQEDDNNADNVNTDVFR